METLVLAFKESSSNADQWIVQIMELLKSQVEDLRVEIERLQEERMWENQEMQLELNRLQTRINRLEEERIGMPNQIQMMPMPMQAPVPIMVNPDYLAYENHHAQAQQQHQVNQMIAFGVSSPPFEYPFSYPYPMPSTSSFQPQLQPTTYTNYEPVGVEPTYNNYEVVEPVEVEMEPYHNNYEPEPVEAVEVAEEGADKHPQPPHQGECRSIGGRNFLPFLCNPAKPDRPRTVIDGAQAQRTGKVAVDCAEYTDNEETSSPDPELLSVPKSDPENENSAAACTASALKKINGIVGLPANQEQQQPRSETLIRASVPEKFKIPASGDATIGTRTLNMTEFVPAKASTSANTAGSDTVVDGVNANTSSGRKMHTNTQPPPQQQRLTPVTHNFQNAFNKGKYYNGYPPSQSYSQRLAPVPEDPQSTFTDNHNHNGRGNTAMKPSKRIQKNIRRRERHEEERYRNGHQNGNQAGHDFSAYY